MKKKCRICGGVEEVECVIKNLEGEVTGHECTDCAGRVVILDNLLHPSQRRKERKGIERLTHRMDI